MRAMIQKGLFGMTVATGLCFGAVQAFAAPRSAVEAQICSDDLCNMDCGAAGYEFGGRCVAGDCVCYEDHR